ncbi:unnamed protein product [Meloidogyne enterolobii]|uniref:Uncharacterized protein n=1 Tax=Meloidogyne enterolobii TaxID=390850 RepID=A0ACB0ZXZ9_MELEN
MANVEENFEEGGGESVTVTIALDLPESSNIKNTRNETFVDNIEVDDEFLNFLSIPLPISPSELLSNFKQKNSLFSSILIKDISFELKNILEIRLSTSSCGSMRNWEFLAACMGLSIDEIVGMRKNENPINILLQKFSDEYFLKLLELIGQSGRVDVLLALEPFIGKISNERKLNKNITQKQQQINPPINLRDSSLLTFSSDIQGHNSSSILQGPFIFILHHENKNNKDLRRLHKMFIKNLERCATERGKKVLDVDNCFSGEDLFGSIQKYFENASQILLALSSDYSEIICTDNEQIQELDQKIQLKRSLHQMTFQENKRFRVLLMRGTGPEHIPRGWPSNTLHYRFPEDFSELCTRLLDGEGERLISNE